MVSLIKGDGQSKYSLNEYTIDNLDDLKLLPINTAIGSKATNTSTGKLYIFTSNNEWVEYVPGGGGGGSSVTIVQTTGTSTSAVMSQNAVTQALNNIDVADKMDKLNPYGFGQFTMNGAVIAEHKDDDTSIAFGKNSFINDGLNNIIIGNQNNTVGTYSMTINGDKHIEFNTTVKFQGENAPGNIQAAIPGDIYLDTKTNKKYICVNTMRTIRQFNDTVYPPSSNKESDLEWNLNETIYFDSYYILGYSKYLCDKIIISYHDSYKSLGQNYSGFVFEYHTYGQPKYDSPTYNTDEWYFYKNGKIITPDSYTLSNTSSNATVPISFPDSWKTSSDYDTYKKICIYGGGTWFKNPIYVNWLEQNSTVIEIIDAQWIEIPANNTGNNVIIGDNNNAVKFNIDLIETAGNFKNDPFSHIIDYYNGGINSPGGKYDTKDNNIIFGHDNKNLNGNYNSILGNNNYVYKYDDSVLVGTENYIALLPELLKSDYYYQKRNSAIGIWNTIYAGNNNSLIGYNNQIYFDSYDALPLDYKNCSIGNLAIFGSQNSIRFKPYSNNTGISMYQSAISGTYNTFSGRHFDYSYICGTENTVRGYAEDSFIGGHWNGIHDVFQSTILGSFNNVGYSEESGYNKHSQIQIFGDNNSLKAKYSDENTLIGFWNTIDCGSSSDVIGNDLIGEMNTIEGTTTNGGPRRMELFGRGNRIYHTYENAPGTPSSTYISTEGISLFGQDNSTNSKGGVISIFGYGNHLNTSSDTYINAEKSTIIGNSFHNSTLPKDMTHLHFAVSSEVNNQPTLIMVSGLDNNNKLYTQFNHPVVFKDSIIVDGLDVDVNKYFSPIILETLSIIPSSKVYKVYFQPYNFAKVELNGVDTGLNYIPTDILKADKDSTFLAHTRFYNNAQLHITINDIEYIYPCISSTLDHFAWPDWNPTLNIPPRIDFYLYKGRFQDDRVELYSDWYPSPTGPITFSNVYITYNIDVVTLNTDKIVFPFGWNVNTDSFHTLDSEASGQYTYAIGNNNNIHANTIKSICLGTSNTITAEHDALAFGASNNIKVNNGIAIGTSNKINANGYAIGNSCYVEGSNALAGGYCTYAKGKSSFAIGENFQPHNSCHTYTINTIDTTRTIIKINGTLPFIIDKATFLYDLQGSGIGKHILIIDHNNNTNTITIEEPLDLNITTIGIGDPECGALGDYSVVTGRLTTALGKHQFVTGCRNIPNDTDLVIVGNGYWDNAFDNNYSNAYTLDKEGNGWYQGKVSTNALELRKENGEIVSITAEQLQQLLALLS